MNIRTQISTSAICLILALGAGAAEIQTPTRDGQILHGRSIVAHKASGDTINLMGPTGGGTMYLGDFEAGWNGWTSVDITQPTSTHWSVSDYNQTLAGNLAAWCGDISITSCNDSLDVVGGYGNNWHDLLAYRATVNNPAASATVAVVGTLQNDTEPGYDYTSLKARIEDNLNLIGIHTWDGQSTIALNDSITYLPGEFVDGTDIHLLFEITSDGGWSDEDCSWPTAGACQIDDIIVTVAQAGQPDIVSFTDFQDGTFGDWNPEIPNGVGDFAQLWSGLADEDPCSTNFSQQVAFIDDGLVVPGTGGSPCINWCYGPRGYIVTTNGGLAGVDAHIQVDIVSPAMTWPHSLYDGVLFSFDVYRHEDLTADTPGIFYTWGVRSADTDDSAGNGVMDLAMQSWRDRNFVYFGQPEYLRVTNDVSDLMAPGRDEVQLRLGVYELGWAWGWIGDDGYPAPYFDNVAVQIFPYVGPSMTTREQDLAQDNFPEVDTIDYGDLGSMHVRFDSARNISLNAHMRIDPGDSVVLDIEPVRSGSTFGPRPEMHYIIDPNPLFDPYRTTPTSGVVLGGPSYSPNKSQPDPYAWSFDLPDTGTLFPGDVLHYYFLGADDVAGDIQFATLPADITGFGDFSDPLAYNTRFIVHALPSITDDGFGGFESPKALFWNDFGTGGGENAWYFALHEVGFHAGEDYDIYHTNAPSSNYVDNGLGSRTAGLALAPYQILAYTAGDLGVQTLGNGDFANYASDDIGTLLTWLASGNKGLLLTGDNLASDLMINLGGAGVAFAEDVMGINLQTSDIRPFIANQVAPLVISVSGNQVIQTNEWIAYGGCATINAFDGVTVRAGAARLAEFTDPSGSGAAYDFSAATANIYGTTNKVVSLPYDLTTIRTAPGSQTPNGMSARGSVLRDIFGFLGLEGPYCVAGPCSPVPEQSVFSVRSHPNPFNPLTRLDYTIRAAGHLSLKIYDMRGHLVRTLIDQEVQTDGYVTWDGTDSAGQRVASGVYFREARMGSDVSVAKMALIK